MTASVRGPVYSGEKFDFVLCSPSLRLSPLRPRSLAPSPGVISESTIRSRWAYRDWEITNTAGVPVDGGPPAQRPGIETPHCCECKRSYGHHGCKGDI